VGYLQKSLLLLLAAPLLLLLLYVYMYIHKKNRHAGYIKCA
jgi:hypothetical protein